MTLKRIILLFVCFITANVKAQDKPPIDTAATFGWTTVSSGKISANGEFVTYLINNQPRGQSTLVIHSLNSRLERLIPNVTFYSLTDANSVIYKIKDTLTIFALAKKEQQTIGQVNSFKVTEIQGRSFLVYKQQNNKLSILDLNSNKKTIFLDVLSYSLSVSGTICLNKENGLYWASTLTGKEKLISKGNAENIIIDGLGKQAAFLTDKNQQKTICYYREGKENTEVLATGIQVDGLNLATLDQFSDDGKRILLHLIEQPAPKPATDAVMVDVWSYTDAKLQSRQLKEQSPKNYLASIKIENKKITRLQYRDESLYFLNGRTDFENVALQYTKGDYTEGNWNPDGRTTYYFNSDITGKISLGFIPQVKIDNLLMGYDTLRQDYLAYDLKLNRVINLTKKISIPRSNSKNDVSFTTAIEFTFAGFLTEQNACIIYDAFDIWKIDLNGKNSPVCITNGFGRRNNIIFRLPRSPLKGIGEITNLRLLLAFNKTTKESGFYEIVKGRINRLSIGSCVYDDLIIGSNPGIYLVGKESTTESKNYFTTKDFKTFNPVSNEAPEIQFNWLTSELVNFVTKSGNKLQGVIYKPENFDKKKKYPCIINYYQELSDEKNRYNKPDLTSGVINIPWFVSRGYIVFTSDIMYRKGYPGQSAFDAIDAARKKLCTLGFIDSLHIGLMGHSFGGYETNYIITQTNKFAAAYSSSGFCDLVSAYNSVTRSGDGFFRQWAEIGQGNIQATLWEKPELYVKNSPIFSVNKITTPLLMMNNRDDGIVNVAQGIEFFSALRRLHKRVWMLQYDNEGHSVINEKASLDLTLRTEQFFEHFLKGTPPAKWITRGIPASLKGIENGLELDNTVNAPNNNSTVPVSN